MIGVAVAVLLSIFFNHYRETLRAWSQYSDLYFPTKEEMFLMDWFFALLSSFMGLSICVWIWLGAKFRTVRRRKRYYISYARTLILLNFGVWLLIVCRWGSVYAIFAFGTISKAVIDPSIPIVFSALILFDLVLFSNSWFVVRLVFRTKYLMALSFLFCTLIAGILFLTTSVDRSIVNNAFKTRYQMEFAYIDSICAVATESYGITLNHSSISTMKQFYTRTSTSQVRILKNAFWSDNKVKLDTILLEIMAVKLAKNEIGIWSGGPKPFSYAHPNAIYKQMQLYKKSDVEYELLFHLLLLEAELWNYKYQKDLPKIKTLLVGRRYDYSKNLYPKETAHYLHLVFEYLQKEESIDEEVAYPIMNGIDSSILHVFRFQ